MPSKSVKSVNSHRWSLLFQTVPSVAFSRGANAQFDVINIKCRSGCLVFGHKNTIVLRQRSTNGFFQSQYLLEKTGGMPNKSKNRKAVSLRMTSQ